MTDDLADSYSPYTFEAEKPFPEMVEPVSEECVMIDGWQYRAVYQNGTIPDWITISVEMADYWMDPESLKP